MNDILNFYAEINAEFLHAKGKAATNYLVSILDCKPDDTVLEIGVGTGATLIKVASKYKSIKLHGVDISELMLNKTRERLKFCGLTAQVELQLTNPSGKLPYADNSFDRIYVESVIAILEKEQIDTMIKEISRVLKPEGLLYANETIWLPETSDSEIERINSFCKKHFGIIQSNGIYKYPQHWKSLLEANGLAVFSMQYADEIDWSSVGRDAGLKERLSAIFSLAGKIKVKLKTSLRREYKNYKNDMDGLQLGGKRYMDGVIIVARNKK